MTFDNVLNLDTIIVFELKHLNTDKTSTYNLSNFI